MSINTEDKCIFILTLYIQRTWYGKINEVTGNKY